MRKPSPIAPLYAWHRAALAGQKPQITQAPQLGWFKTRLAKDSVWSPARVWLQQDIDGGGELVADERIQCEVGGQEYDPQEIWLWLAGHPIAESEYRYLMALHGWARESARNDPHANPNQPIDFNSARLPF